MKEAVPFDDDDDDDDDDDTVANARLPRWHRAWISLDGRVLLLLLEERLNREASWDVASGIVFIALRFEL